MTPPFRPAVLVIRDGWGRNPHPEHDAFNAVHLARTPVADRLERDWPTTLIRTCGEDVGLPAGTMGNSEVGHQNIGAGRIVNQEIMRITASIRDGSFFDNGALVGAFEHAAATGGNVHLIGLVSNGRVHSDLDHLLALIELAARRSWPSDRLFVHAFADGRDTGPRTAGGFMRTVEAKMRDVGVGRVASVIGRFYAMDRDHRWERVALAYAALTGRRVDHPRLNQTGVVVANSASATDAIESYGKKPIDTQRASDEFITPTQIIDLDTGAPIGPIDDGDAVIFFNFRGDRPREITKAFILDDAAWSTVTDGGFKRGRRLANLYFCGMTMYESGLPLSAVAFDKPARMPDILGQVVSDAGHRQFRCAETEKFPHVTFFFNDYREEPFAGEERVIAPSPRHVTTYDLAPEMSAALVRDAVLARLAADDVDDLIVVNFANGDMVGHTGNLQSTIVAIETVDACTGAIIDAALARGGVAVVTADHGNAEQMWNPETKAPHTAHTVYDVPLSIIGNGLEGRALRDGGRLADLAPTLLELLGAPIPAAMTGRSLLA
ncbi:MAG: 2,3-bisphosphoglycerate-independent phosphoglycerate mutase [Phycisphaerales bacterium]|nr:2,3-bisphosphoglycerate-independent phosphoglycerate mutase [Phycisphaerales bacterium]